MAKKFEEIKEEEYPYELPEGWKFLDSTKYVGLENIEKDTGIIKYEIGAELKSIKNVFVEGQILYGKLRPYLNKHGIAKFKGVCSTDILVFSANNDVSNKWVDYYFNMPSFISYAISNSTGINLPRVNSKSILSYVIPIPPKETQQKIVDIIESLFAKLDIAQEKVEQVLAESENRRSAILHNAFSGKLTEKWREENNVSFDSWNEYKIKDIAKNIKDKYDPEKDKFLNIPYIGLEHIEKNNGIVGFSSSEGVKSIKTLFNKNDVLYGKLRPYLDKHDIAEYNGMCSTDIIVYRCKLKETAIILNYVMSTKQFIEYAVTNSKGINLPRTSEKIISEYKLQLPLLTEQKEIVRLLDNFLSVEDKVKSTCQNTLEAIATMRKSILAKAFRGELCS